MSHDDKKINVADSQGKNRLVRLLGITLGVVVLLIVVKSYFDTGDGVIPDDVTLAEVKELPRVESIPGVGNPSEEYVSLQNQQNQIDAQVAEAKGTSALPTISRASLVKDNLPINQQATLAARDEECSVEALVLARKSGVSAMELRCKGCDAEALKAAGYTAGELRVAGFTAKDLKRAGFSARNLREAGFDSKDLVASGFSAKDLGAAGFSAAELVNAGLKPQAILDAGFSPDQLKAAGVSAAELKAAGVSASELVAAGFSPKNLSQAGFSLNDLRRAGVSGDALSAAGLVTTKKINCSVEDLVEARNRGVTAKALKDRGCDVAALKAAGYTAAELKDAGFSAAELREAGFSPAELKQAGYTAAELKDAGFSAKDLSAAGFSAKELKGAGFSAKDLKAAGFTPEELKAAGLTAKDLKDAGFSAKDLKEAGFAAKDLAAGGFSAADMLKAGLTAKDLKDAGFSAKDLRDAGVDARALKVAGFAPEDLNKAGFTEGDLVRAGYSDSQLARSGVASSAAIDCTVLKAQKAKQAGVSAKDLKNRGCSASVLNRSGYTAKDLAKAGFIPEQLYDAGYSAKDLLAAGMTPEAINDAGYSKVDLLNAGVAKESISGIGESNEDKRAKCDVELIRQQMNLGIPAEHFKKLGCNLSSLLAAGFNPEDLHEAGFSAQQLKTAGVSDQALVAAGIAKDGTDLADSVLTPELLQQVVQALGKSNNKSPVNDSNLTELQRQQKQMMEDQKNAQSLANKKQAMSGQASALLQGWSKTGVQQIQEAAFDKNSVTIGQMAAGSMGKNGSGVALSGEVIKAGSILFAVIDTSINSDNPGPVLATIVEGPLKGAKIIGSFVRQDEQLLLSFNRISIPAVTNSLGFSAIAVDQNTSRTALASSVDTHAWLRYGSLFLSSFMEGLGQAVINAGSNLTVGDAGGSTWELVRNDLSFGEQTLAALGVVGQRFGNVMAPVFATPPTVRLYSGTGVGLLFMNDFPIPAAVMQDTLGGNNYVR